MAKKKENKIVLMRGEAEFHYIALVIMILLMIFSVPRFFSQDRKIHYN